VSPSGRLVASNACGIERCDLQVVEVETRVVHRPVREAAGFLRALTDDAVVTTDDASGWIAARGIADGRERWRVTDRALFDPVARADGSVVGVVGSPSAGWAVSSIDRSGRFRDLTTRGRADGGLPRLWRALSTDDRLVIGTATFEEAVITGRPTALSLVDPATANALPASASFRASTETLP
jgi:hypothetical protein